MQRLPTLISAKIDENNVQILLKIDKNIEDFKGHFDSFPVFPGVSQIDLAVLYAREYLDLTGEFAGMEVIKFQSPILPDATVSLSLTWAREKKKLYFHYQSDDAEHSCGRILFSEAK